MRTMRRIQHIIRYYEQIILCNFRTPATSHLLNRGFVGYIRMSWLLENLGGTSQVRHFFFRVQSLENVPANTPSLLLPPTTDITCLPPFPTSGTIDDCWRWGPQKPPERILSAFWFQLGAPLARPKLSHRSKQQLSVAFNLYFLWNRSRFNPPKIHQCIFLAIRKWLKMTLVIKI